MEGTIGEIRLFAGTFAPRGWAICTGQSMSIQAYTALFSILGTNYGGDGRSTFFLPNFSGRTAIGAGQSPGTSDYVVGEEGGTPSVTLLITELPVHNHAAVLGTSTPGSATVSVSISSSADTSTAAGNYLGMSSDGTYFAPGTAPTIAMASQELSFTSVTGGSQITGFTIATNGSSGPHNNMQPYLVLNYLICISGDFPVRN